MIKLDTNDIIEITPDAGPVPVMIDLVYTSAEHAENIFQTAVYKPDARLWAHRDLAAITLRAAEICYQNSGYYFEIKDSLRPVEAQEIMIKTPIVQKNPHWIGPLLAKPGIGGHPRGMAIDIVLRDHNSDLVPMGTQFDYFDEDPAKNPAARTFTDLPENILKNRQILEDAMVQAGGELGRKIWPLPTEWWDFRFYPEDYNRFEPLSDHALSEIQKLVF